MKSDYPKANARLAEVAKSWADGEVSHEAWRKERRSIIQSIKGAKDEPSVEPPAAPKRVANRSSTTLPTIPVPAVLSPHHGLAGASMAKSQDMLHEDALLLAVLLLAMIIVSILLLYLV